VFFDFQPKGDAMPTGQLSAAVCLVCLAILPGRLSAQDSKAPDNKTQDDVLVTQPRLPQGTGERSQGDDAGGSAIGSLPDEAILRQLGVSPDRDGLSKMLGGLSSSDKQRRHIAALIAQLGSDDYGEREAATAALQSLPRPPLRELQAATESLDPEMKYRARKILAATGESSVSVVLFAACRVIAREKLTGLARELLDAAAEVDNEPARTAMRLAMEATVGADDVPLLSAALRSQHFETRIAAVWGLSAVGGTAALEPIQALLGDNEQQPAVRLAAAEAMAIHERPAGITALVALLDADDAAVRRKALALLRAASGKSFDFDPDAPAEKRGQQRAHWAAWLKDDGRIVMSLAPPKVGWTDYFDHRLVFGKYDNARTEFVRDVPKLLRDHFQSVTRTADTTGSVIDRHTVAKWLYPVEGEGERPRVMVEDKQRLYPVWGSWQQRWQDWIVLNENSAYIENAAAHGGPHWESRLTFIVVPVDE
jgi:hypothetical protein